MCHPDLGLASGGPINVRLAGAEKTDEPRPAVPKGECRATSHNPRNSSSLHDCGFRRNNGRPVHGPLGKPSSFPALSGCKERIAQAARVNSSRVRRTDRSKREREFYGGNHEHHRRSKVQDRRRNGS